MFKHGIGPHMDWRFRPLRPLDLSPWEHSRLDNDISYGVNYNNYISALMQKDGTNEFLTSRPLITDEDVNENPTTPPPSGVVIPTDDDTTTTDTDGEAGLTPDPDDPDLNENTNDFIRNPNYPNFATIDPASDYNNYITFSKTWTLAEKIDWMLENNPFGLDQTLVVFTPKGQDRPLNLSNHIYQAFYEHFFEWPINQQTIDLHKIKLETFFRSRKYRLQGLFEALFQRSIDSTQTRTGTNNTNYTDTSLNRGATSTVPENEVNVDVDSTSLTYADSFYKNKSVKTHVLGGTTTSITTNSQEINLWRYLTMDSELDFLYREAIAEELFMCIR